jgi:hypothetical protein
MEIIASCPSQSLLIRYMKFLFWKQLVTIFNLETWETPWKQKKIKNIPLLTTQIWGP